ncbi:hypothetical protein J5N97_002851 [Dioscorea zingiberensis]|uniref:Leucine-rich repeat-containing N-terminal plant-type domain-containing protein n=1 Tax=Dioscorea zingiberensis TaxID=325984 RepID=A0A9D5HPI6_9LILI|nr:hypothetical protein J5N97_002851 [Dioscorea zingiberensis]
MLTSPSHRRRYTAACLESRRPPEQGLSYVTSVLPLFEPYSSSLDHLLNTYLSQDSQAKTSTRMSKLTLPQMIFILLLLLYSSFPLLVFSTKCHNDDTKTLLNLKAGFGNPVDLPWTSDTDCCSWSGVTCHSDTGRVLYLDFYEVNLSGSISPAIGDLPLLSHINIVDSPMLSGTIPPSITNLPLTSLTIMYTNLSGPIPDFLGDLTNLTDLDLSGNLLTGPIPTPIASLPKLNTLFLSGNKLTGTIPPSLFHSPPRREWLDLSDNLLTGEIPRSLGDADVPFIFLSGNCLTGDASFLFGAEKRTSEIDLSNNQLEMNMSSLSFPLFLRTLDLSHNRIYGTIPDSIADLPVLSTFNVSYNVLCGRIPTGAQMVMFDESCYAHNECLCGTPLPSCPVGPTAIPRRCYDASLL